MKSSIIALSITALISLSSNLAVAADEEPENSQLASQGRCYWMENYSGKSEWVPAADVYGRELSKNECYKLDSCGGGLGKSKGGCYKWATGPSDAREAWDRAE